MSELLTLDILGLPFGLDRQNQLFDERTSIGLEVGESVPAFYYHGFSERAASSVSRIGRAVYQGIGTLAGRRGHVFKAMLDGGRAIAQKIFADALAGRARVSSDSMAHLVRPYGILGKAGVVTSWPISGISLMDASTFESAINPDAVALAAAKASRPGLVVARRSGAAAARVQPRHQAAIDVAVKACWPHINRAADQMVRAEWRRYIDHRIAVELSTPEIHRRMQRRREWLAGLRDTQ